jgi:hypothetical protein
MTKVGNGYEMMTDTQIIHAKRVLEVLQEGLKRMGGALPPTRFISLLSQSISKAAREPVSCPALLTSESIPWWYTLGALYTPSVWQLRALTAYPAKAAHNPL